jgi:hypothetical protein
MAYVELKEKRTEDSAVFYVGEDEDFVTIQHKFGNQRHYPRGNGTYGKQDLTFEDDLINDKLNPHGREYDYCFSRAARCTEVDEAKAALGFWLADDICIHFGGDDSASEGTLNEGQIEQVSSNSRIKTKMMPWGFKREWELTKEPTTPEEYIKTFKSPINFQGCTMDGNNVIDSNNKVLGHFKNAYCYESTGTALEQFASIRPVEVTFTTNQMTVIVDTTGMDYSKNIIIDPIFILPTSNADNFLFLLNPTDNWGGAFAMGCYGFPGQTQRPIMSMNFSALDDSALITNATVSMHCNVNGGGFVGTEIIECNWLTQAFGEGTSSGASEIGGSAWIYSANPTTWTPGGPFTLVEQAVTTIPAQGTRAIWDVTDQIKRAQSDNAEIWNALFKLADEANPVTNANLQFYSRENGIDTPELIITYILPVGVANNMFNPNMFKGGVF